MKLTKYFILAGAALLLTACSNDDEVNTASGVTVEMGTATLKVKENAPQFYVPLKLTGKTNGEVKVHVQVSEYSENPAKENVHYYLTSATVTFPTDSAQVALEFLPVNDMEVNEDRAFMVTITSVEGASIGTQNTTIVTIRDDDGLFYEAIQGQWTITGTGFFDGSSVTNTWDIKGIEDEDDPNYEKLLTIAGWGGRPELQCEAQYMFDVDTETITIYIPFDQVLGQLNFSGLGVCDVVLYGVDGDYLADEGGAYVTVSADLRTLTFDPAEVFYYGVVSNGEYMGGWNGIENLHGSR